MEEEKDLTTSLQPEQQPVVDNENTETSVVKEPEMKTEAPEEVSVETKTEEVSNEETKPEEVSEKKEQANEQSAEEQPTVEEVVAEEAKTEEESVEEQPKSENYLNSKWYVLHTFSGYENVAKENLEIVREKFNLQDRIFEINIPMEDVVEEKNGKRKVVSRKLMPSYILVKMLYGDDIWHAVTLTRGITGFAGPKGRPLPLTEEEVRKMHLEKLTVVDIDLAPNDKVEVLDGPLNGFAGTVTSVDYASEKCRVVVEMFGRETPVDLSLTQVRKLN